MADVFLSYSKSDRSLAQSVVQELESLGFSVWWDDRLTPNESWDKLIEDEIEDAKVVVVLWTTASIRSDWVRTEATYGKDNRKLIQARCEEISPPLAFTLLQRAELGGWRAGHAHDGWSRLVDWASAMTGVRPTRSAAPQPNLNIPYWEAFHAVAEGKGVRRPILTPVKATNYYLYLSKKPEICVAAYVARSGGGEINAYMATWYEPAQTIFEALKAQRAQIESEVGETLQWTQQGPTTYWISFEPVGANPDEKADWPRQHALLADRMARLKAAIAPRLPDIIATLPPPAPS